MFVIIFVICVFIIFSAGIFSRINRESKRIAVDHYFLEMRKASLHNQYIAAFDMYGFIKAEFSSYGYYDEFFVQMEHSWGRQFDNDLYYKMLNKRFKKIFPKIKTNNFSDLITKGYIYTSFAQEKENYYELADQIYKQLIALSPDMPLLYRLYANMLFAKGDYEQAVLEHRAALENLPSLDSYGLNLKHKNLIKDEMGRNFEGLIGIYEEIGDEEKAGEYRRKIQELTDL